MFLYSSFNCVIILTALFASRLSRLEKNILKCFLKFAKNSVYLVMSNLVLLIAIYAISKSEI